MEDRMTLNNIKTLINSENWSARSIAFQACVGRSDVPLEWLEKGVNDIDKDVRCSTFQVCIGRSDIPLEWLEKGVKDEDWRVRCTAFKACAGRSDIPLEWLERGMSDKDCDVRCSTFQVCICRSDVPLEWLEKGVKDKSSDVRLIGFQACIDRSDVPLEWLERGATDRVSYVRTTVSKILFDMGYQFPLVRMVEPANKVYKKCLMGVIVVAEIPKTAQVRGINSWKCRASEAVIVEVIPNKDGCAEAVSIWDYKITYKVGDHIIIDNFDHSNEECSTGFHFFNTLGEAKSY